MTVCEVVTAHTCVHVCDCVCLAHLSTIYVYVQSMQPSWALMASLGIRACRPCTRSQHGHSIVKPSGLPEVSHNCG